MDSLTQLVLGAGITAALAPASQRRRALLLGAALGTLPDLDVIPLALLDVDAISRVTLHRGASHSLFVLTLLAPLLWWLARQRWPDMANRRWLLAIWLTLITHPLLDALTIYGTQLWWPLMPAPAMWGSVFVIDPLYTLPLLLACLLAWWRPAARLSQSVLVAALGLSSAYLGWSLYAQQRVDAVAERALARLGLADAPRFVTPAPLNTVLWRVVVIDGDRYLQGLYSLAADGEHMQFSAHPRGRDWLAMLAEHPEVQRYRWFASDFVRIRQEGERLILSDLRMGHEPDYVFSYQVATLGGHMPRPQRSERVDTTRGPRVVPGELWRRMWQGAPELRDMESAHTPRPMSP
ncbi:metal-dependent hydrolase [Chitinilyticum litopenaei]|uniref:metal-dependent hydrolase n=1 Tax=Chitinilyticum litopenaei TaxID=1121276 RepID=UPI0003FD2871|nr:metal-dependent hydrolase [Chitinilyticum litopenaei]